MYTVCELLGFQNYDFRQVAELVARQGMGGVAVPRYFFEEGNEKKALEAGRMVLDLGLQWYFLPTPIDFYEPYVSPAQFDQALEDLKRWAELGRRMGIRRAYNHVWASNPFREYDENFAWHVPRIQKVYEVCADNDIFYGLEFVSTPGSVCVKWKYPFVHTIAGVRALSREATGGKAGFLYDTYHAYFSNNDRDDLFYALTHADQMVGLHINDGVPGISREEADDLVRAMPMTTGVIDSLGAVRRFARRGYGGPVLAEPIYPFLAHVEKIPWQDAVMEYAQAYARVFNQL